MSYLFKNATAVCSPYTFSIHLWWSPPQISQSLKHAVLFQEENKTNDEQTRSIYLIIAV